jgi:hypothetical protein
MEPKAKERVNIYIIEICRVVLQSFFMCDVLFRIHAQFPNWKHFFHDNWNTGDLVLMLVTTIPAVTYGSVGKDLTEYFGLLSVLRVLRIFRILNWVHDLNVSTDAFLCFSLLCFALMFFAMLCFALLCFAAVLCYAMLCFAMLCYALLCYALLCFAVLSFALLCHFLTSSLLSLCLR